MLDPGITLFGRRIKLKGNNNNNNINEKFNESIFDEQLENEVDKEVTDEESMENDQQDDEYLAEAMDESTNASAMSGQTEKPIDSEKDSESQQDDEKESNDTKDSQQKLLKKPDKILPCPRCSSMDTKFCYYNNYNVNQPRHFCKSCQRYWTAGGTMRNVPVGAGRRKNKNSASRYCHITMSEALQAARFDISNGVHPPGLKTNGTVLTFGSDNLFSESMTSVVNISDKKVLNGTTRNRDDRLSGSTVTSCSIEDRSKKGEQGPKQFFEGVGNQIPGFQWPYMWNPAIPVPPPFCPAVFPVPIYPHPTPWNVPWVVPHCLPTQNSPGSNPSSPNLGKHTRDGQMVTAVTPSSTTAKTTTSTVLMPKTLRIDNPDEAAKSSIWSTLGIKKDKSDSLSKGFFSNFQPKEADKNDGNIDASQAFIQANPVALCRSFNFQERAN